MADKNPLQKLERLLPLLLFVGGLVGIVASLILMYDQIQIWKNPAYTPACNLNPLVSCGTVIDSGEGKVLGLPAPLLGMLAFPVLVTLGVAMWSGSQFKRWFWRALEVGLLGGFVFALWLFWVSLYRIHALCPFCLTTDIVVFVLVWYVTLYNLQKGHIVLPKRYNGAVRFVQKHHLDFIVLWLLIMVAIILQHFWYYFGKQLF